MRISLEEAANLLNSGKVVAVPTETVYGLAASLKYPQAIQEIYTLKGRPSNNPLIIHVAQVKEIYFYLQDDINLDALADVFWPGPMTLALPVKTHLIPSIVRADLPTAAFRIPAHPLAQKLLHLTGPLVMPSANLSGRPSSTQRSHIENDFGVSFPILDGGGCDKGLESTILLHRLGKWEIIRQGALSPEDFQSTLGYIPLVQNITPGEKPLCPGQMYRHYAPKAKLKLLNSCKDLTQGTVIGFSDRSYPSKCLLFALGPLSQPDLIASNLYAILRKIDEEGCSEVYVDMDFLQTGILATLAERLYKAAS